MKTIKHYINGSTVSYSQKYLPVTDPSNGEQIANVCSANSKDFEHLIKSSIESQKEWANVTPLMRSRIISKYKNIIEKNIDNLARIISTEHGKTLDDA